MYGGRVEVAAVIANICEMLVGDVPEENCRRAQAYLDRLLYDLRNEMAHAADLVPPALVPEMPPEPPGPLATARDLDELARPRETCGRAFRELRVGDPRTRRRCGRSPDRAMLSTEGLPDPVRPAAERFGRVGDPPNFGSETPRTCGRFFIPGGAPGIPPGSTAA